MSYRMVRQGFSSVDPSCPALGLEYVRTLAQMLAHEKEERHPASTVFLDVLICRHKGVSGYPCLRQNGT